MDKMKNPTDRIKNLEWPINLFTKIDPNNVSNMYDILLLKVLNTLTTKEKEIILKYFKEHLTLDEIGKDYNVTKNRVMQLKDRAIRKLKHPSRTQYLFLKDYIIKLEAENQHLNDYILQLRSSKPIKDKEGNALCIWPLDTPINQFNFSVRVYHSLYRGGFRTLRDLIITLTQSPKDFSKLRNMGNKGLIELQDWFNKNTDCNIKIIDKY